MRHICVIKYDSNFNLKKTTIVRLEFGANGVLGAVAQCQQDMARR